MAGNRARYEDLLRRFAAQQTAALPDLRSSWDSGDLETVRRQAHTLKGVAANLGASDLAAAAGEVEAAIDSGAGVRSEVFSRLLLRIQDVSATIQSTLPSALTDENDQTTAVPVRDSAALLKAVSRLREMLRISDGLAGEYFRTVRPELASIVS